MGIRFTKGSLERVSKNYLNLTLYINEEVVYKSTICNDDACVLMDRHSCIRLID
jgi:hypothetical protein